MKKVKIAGCVLICLAFCAILVGCGATKENVVGIWNCSYVHEGNDFEQTLKINSDGSFEKTVKKNGSTTKTVSGKWTIENGELVIKESGEDATTTYKLNGDTLSNGDSIRMKKIG